MGGAMLIILGFILVHFAIYILKIRNIALFKQEKWIFLYHFIPFVFITGLMLFIEEPLILKFGMASAIVIYNITFLEFWSLAQGSYSLSILQAAPIIVSDLSCRKQLADIGDRKFAGRIDGLIGLKILIKNGEELKLTVLGKLIGLFLYSIRLLTNSRNIG